MILSLLLYIVLLWQPQLWLGFLNKFTPVSAIVLAALIIPLKPISIPLQATACQLCAGTPGTQVAVESPAVGTTQLTSPTSVEAGHCARELVFSNFLRRIDGW